MVWCSCLSIVLCNPLYHVPHQTVWPHTLPTSRGTYGLEWIDSFGCERGLLLSHDKAVIARTLLSVRKCDGSNDAVTPLLHALPYSGAWPLYMCLNGNQSAFVERGV